MRNVPGSLPLPIHDRSSTSRASSHRTYASLQSRRASSAQGCRGIAVSGSRAGAARAAAILLLSCHVLPSELQKASALQTRLGTGPLGIYAGFDVVLFVFVRLTWFRLVKSHISSLSYHFHAPWTVCTAPKSLLKLSSFVYFRSTLAGTLHNSRGEKARNRGLVKPQHTPPVYWLHPQLI